MGRRRMMKEATLLQPDGEAEGIEQHNFVSTVYQCDYVQNLEVPFTLQINISINIVKISFRRVCNVLMVHLQVEAYRNSIKTNVTEIDRLSAGWPTN